MQRAGQSDDFQIRPLKGIRETRGARLAVIGVERHTGLAYPDPSQIASRIAV